MSELAPHAGRMEVLLEFALELSKRHVLTRRRDRIAVLENILQRVIPGALTLLRAVVGKGEGQESAKSYHGENKGGPLFRNPSLVLATQLGIRSS